MTSDDRFAGTKTLEERVPLATDEELRALVSFFDTDSLRTQFAAVLAAARLELSRRSR
jgi:predicted mannosyl-3-phosphoglycerate phosphatase (HAD superfamily)